MQVAKLNKYFMINGSGFTIRRQHDAPCYTGKTIPGRLPANDDDGSLGKREGGKVGRVNNSSGFSRRTNKR